MNLRWRDLQFHTSNMSEAELDSSVTVYNSLFARIFEVRAIDHLDTFNTGKRSKDGSPLVLVIDNAKT